LIDEIFLHTMPAGLFSLPLHPCAAAKTAALRVR
jgi:hypothetical protein